MNHYFLSKVFHLVEVGFLPMGHNHADVDQLFSATSSNFLHSNAVTLSDLHLAVSDCYNEHRKVTGLESVIKFVGPL